MAEAMATTNMTTRPPLPPFTRETATKKVRLAEDVWNSRDPGKVALGYAIDSRWRNRSEFIDGRNEIIAFLSRKWAKELDYRLIKELWAFTGNRIAVRFAYEWHDGSGHWYRSYGNENWEFNDEGLMASRFASINDLPISESDRKYHWLLGRRPEGHPGLRRWVYRGSLRGLGTTGPLPSGDPSGIQIASLTARDRRTITMNATLLILRMMGLGLAAHEAQKLLGWFGGGGISGPGAFFQSIGFRAGWSICPNCAAGATIFCRLERSGR